MLLQNMNNAGSPTLPLLALDNLVLNKVPFLQDKKLLCSPLCSDTSCFGLLEGKPCCMLAFVLQAGQIIIHANSGVFVLAPSLEDSLLVLLTPESNNRLRYTAVGICNV